MQKEFMRHDVHVHLLAAPGVQEMDGSTWWVLDDAERARVVRLRRPADQWLHACAHTLLRHVLSGHAPVDPAEWRFERARDGKPALCHRHHPGLHPLRFNLSHCPGLVAVVVAHDREVGVDVEHVDGLHDPAGLASTILTPQEWRLWDETEPTDLARRHFLLERWTLKEAALKAMGFGLGRIELDRFGLVQASGSEWLLLPFDGHSQPHQHWTVCTSPVAPPHRLAIAWERLPGEPDPAVRRHHWTTEHLRTVSALHPSLDTACTP